MSPVRWLLVLLWMLGIWWLSDQPNLHSGLAQDFVLRKIVHLLEFGVLSVLLTRAGPPRRQAARAALVIALAYALLDEWHQSWIIGRHGAFSDVAIDTVGIVIGMLCLRIWPRRAAARAVTS